MTIKKAWLILGSISFLLWLPILVYVRSSPTAPAIDWRAVTKLRRKMALICQGREQRGNKQAQDSVQYAGDKPTGEPVHFWRDVGFPLLRMPRFWVILCMSAIVTASREALNAYSTQLLVFCVGVDPADAGILTAVSAIVATLSIACSGYLFDKVKKRTRVIIPPIAYLVTFLFYLGLWIYVVYALKDDDANRPRTSRDLAAVMILLSGMCFFSAGPSSLLDGAYVVELIGAKGAAFGAGLSSGVGYAGGALATYFLGLYATSLSGFRYLIGCVTLMAGLLVIAGCLFAWMEWVHWEKVRVRGKMVEETTELDSVKVEIP